MILRRRRRLLLASSAMLGAVGVALMGWTSHAIAQPSGKQHRVALVFGLTPVSEILSPEPTHPHGRVFYQALRALGYIEGKNLIYEPRSGEGNLDRVPEIIAELVRLKVDVIVTAGNEVPLRAIKVTTTVPIVSWQLSDPVEAGLVKSLARPGGNLTGIIQLDTGVEAKRLQLLKEAVPKVTRVAYLATRRFWDSPSGHATRTSAVRMNITLTLGELQLGRGYSDTFEMLSRTPPDALFVAGIPENWMIRRAIVDYATKARLPSSFGGREHVELGGFMAYGSDPLERPRRAATYVDKILRGAKPGDLPVEQLDTYELVLNLKTARYLGITFPQSLVLRADRVIE